jgi:hypothetical protein
MAHKPLKMTIAEAQAEVRQGWTDSYSPDAIASAVDSLDGKPLWLRISMFIGRLSFRGIYFPQIGRWAWMKVALQNRRTIFKLARAVFNNGWRKQPVVILPTPTVKPQTDGQEA